MRPRRGSLKLLRSTSLAGTKQVFCRTERSRVRAEPDQPQALQDSDRDCRGEVGARRLPVRPGRLEREASSAGRPWAPAGTAGAQGLG